MDYSIRKFNLRISGEYDSSNCYKSLEADGNTPIISGIYIKKLVDFRNLPDYILMNLLYPKDMGKYDDFIRSKEEEFRMQKKRYYITDNLFKLPTILSYKKLMDNKVYYQYEGMNLHNLKIIKDVYIHNKFLQPSPPNNLLIELVWLFENEVKTTSLVCFNPGKFLLKYIVINVFFL